MTELNIKRVEHLETTVATEKPIRLERKPRGTYYHIDYKTPTGKIRQYDFESEEARYIFDCLGAFFR